MIPNSYYFLVVPWLDVKNKSDDDYSDMCFNLFRYKVLEYIVFYANIFVAC